MSHLISDRVNSQWQQRKGTNNALWREIGKERDACDYVLDKQENSVPQESRGAVEVNTTSLFQCNALWKNLPHTIGDRRARLQGKQPRGFGSAFPRIYANSIPKILRVTVRITRRLHSYTIESIHIHKFDFLNKLKIFNDFY